MNAWSYYWVYWFFGSAAAFLVPELWALLSGHPENTLSDNTWRLEGFLPGQDFMHWTPIHIGFTVVLIAFTVWLIGHLCFRAWA